MNRISLSSVPTQPVDTPSLLDLPEDAIGAVISSIGKADNRPLARLAQTCKDFWRLAGPDALLSYFYAACAAYESRDTETKVFVFRTLCEWIKQVANQLPTESRWQIIEHLSYMGEESNLSPSRAVDHLHLEVLSSIEQALKSVLEVATRELDDHWATVDAADTSPGAGILEAGFVLKTSLDRLSALQSNYHVAWRRKRNAVFEPPS